MYLNLRQKHLDQLQVEQAKVEYSFRARRKLLATIGLPEVKMHRMRQLLAEEETWKRSIEHQRQVLPELVAITIVRIN